MIPVYLGSAQQSVGDTPANVFRANVPFKLRLLHQLRGLFTRSAQKEGATRIVQRVSQIPNGAKPRGINGSHVAQTEDHDGRQRFDGIENAGKFVGCTDKKRRVNAVNESVVRD